MLLLMDCLLLLLVLNFITGYGLKMYFIYIYIYVYIYIYIYMTLTFQSIKNHCKFLIKRDLLDIRLNIMCRLCLDPAVN